MRAMLTFPEGFSWDLNDGGGVRKSVENAVRMIGSDATNHSFTVDQEAATEIGAPWMTARPGELTFKGVPLVLMGE